MKCGQRGCPRLAIYRYTWPSQAEQGVCESHVLKVKALADAAKLSLAFYDVPQSTFARSLFAATFAGAGECAERAAALLEDEPGRPGMAWASGHLVDGRWVQVTIHVGRQAPTER